MSDHLSGDLLTVILAKLPVKDIVRFRCVCTIWDSLISSHSFFDYHLNKSATNSINSNLHILGYWDFSYVTTRVFDLLSEDDEIEFIDTISLGRKTQFFPFGIHRTNLSQGSGRSCPVARIVGCCNGLLCLKLIYSSCETRYVLWNPSIRKCRLLATSYSDCVSTFVGFGYDSITCDYKLVRDIDNEIELFSEKRGSWRKIRASISPDDISSIDVQHAVFLNGACHFLVDNGEYGYDTNNFRCFILAFDVHEELFHKIAIPDSILKHQQQHRRGYGRIDIRNIMVSHDGFLSLVLFKQIDQHNFWYETNVWVMKEYGVAESWTKVFDSFFASPYSSYKSDCGRFVIGYGANYEFLFPTDYMPNDNQIDPNAEELVSYDPRTMIEQSSRMIGTSFYCSTFIESLALVDGVQQEDMERNLKRWGEEIPEEIKEAKKKLRKQTF